MRTRKNKVFISCGQRTPDEKYLGEKIQDLVREITPFEPYFAEYQTTLDGLTANIFSELYSSFAFITVMHRRGVIEHNTKSRASVWVEQEIAIAAFIKEVLKINLHVLALTEPGIELEGVRSQLLLNPVEFSTNDEALKHVSTGLRAWTDVQAHESLELILRKENKKITAGRHEYDYVVEVKNAGAMKVNEYHVDIEFPKTVLFNAKFTHEIEGRSSKTHLLLRSPLPNQMEPIYPGDTKMILRLNYYVDNRIHENQSLMDSLVKVTLYDSEQVVAEESLKFREIQEF